MIGAIILIIITGLILLPVLLDLGTEREGELIIRQESPDDEASSESLLQDIDNLESSYIVAVLASKVGPAAVGGIKVFNASRFAVDKINAAGGIHGKQLRIIEYDVASSSIVAARAAEDVAEKEIIAVIGAVWSSQSLAIAGILNDAGIPMITPTSTHPDVTKTGEYIFRICYSDVIQGRVAGQFVKDELGIQTTAVLINQSNPYSKTLAKHYLGFLNQYNSIETQQFSYVDDILDDFDFIDDLRVFNPDIVFLPGYTHDSTSIISACIAAGLDLQFMGGDGWDWKQFAYSGFKGFGHFSMDHWHNDISRDESDHWIQEYKRITGDALDSAVPVLTMDAWRVLAEALKKSDGSRSSLRDQIEQTYRFPGLTGEISLDYKGDAYKPIVIQEYTPDKLVFRKVISPEICSAFLYFDSKRPAGMASPVSGTHYRDLVRFSVEQSSAYGSVPSVGAFLQDYDLQNYAGRASADRIEDYFPSQQHPDIVLPPVSHEEFLTRLGSSVLNSALIPGVVRNGQGDSLFNLNTNRLSRILYDFLLTQFKEKPVALLVEADDSVAEETSDLLALLLKRAQVDVRSVYLLNPSAESRTLIESEISRDSVIVLAGSRQFFTNYFRNETFPVRDSVTIIGSWDWIAGTDRSSDDQFKPDIIWSLTSSTPGFADEEKERLKDDFRDEYYKELTVIDFLILKAYSAIFECGSGDPPVFADDFFLEFYNGIPENPVLIESFKIAEYQL